MWAHNRLYMWLQYAWGIGLCGALVFTRIFSDAYKPLPLTAGNIISIVVPWLIVLSILLALYLSKEFVWRRDLVLLVLLEFAVGGCLTWGTFHLSIFNHRIEDHKRISDMLTKTVHDDHPKQIGPFLLENAYYKGPAVIFRYRSPQGMFFDEGAMRDKLHEEACGFLHFAEHGALQHVSYSFAFGSPDEANQDAIIVFTHKDCVPSAQVKEASPSPYITEPRKAVDAQLGISARGSEAPVRLPDDHPPSLSVSHDPSQADKAQNVQQESADDLNKHLETIATDVDKLEKEMDQFNKMVEQLAKLVVRDDPLQAKLH